MYSVLSEFHRLDYISAALHYNSWQQIILIKNNIQMNNNNNNNNNMNKKESGHWSCAKEPKTRHKAQQRRYYLRIKNIVLYTIENAEQSSAV